MRIAFEGYTAEGLIRGTFDPGERVEDALERSASLVVDGAELVLVDGSDVAAGRATVATDDLVAVVPPPAVVGPIHAVWHDIDLAAGPYLIEGLLPTVPGFDPARALARPSGTFVLIGSARIALAAEPGAGAADYPLLWVNRYAVDRIEADIELSLFFPGARTAVSSGVGRDEGTLPPRVAAGTD